MKKSSYYTILSSIMSVSVFILGFYLITIVSSLYDFSEQYFLVFLLFLIILIGLIFFNARLSFKRRKNIYESFGLHALTSVSIILMVYQLSVSISSVTPESKTELLKGYWVVGLLIAILFEIALLIPKLTFRNISNKV